MEINGNLNNININNINNSNPTQIQTNIIPIIQNDDTSNEIMNRLTTEASLNIL